MTCLCYILYLLTLATLICQCKSNTITFYVSPNGNNNNNGSSPISPFKTLEYTQSMIREIKNNSNHNPTQFIINLMQGTFYLTNGKSLDFNSKDSGYSIDNNIVYQSYEKNNDSVIVSGGFPVPSICFKQVGIYQTVKIYGCDLSQYTNSIKKPNFRSLRIGLIRATPSRYPKLPLNGDPYLDGWLIINSSQYLNDSDFLIGVTSTDLSPSLAVKNPGFIQGNVHLFPTRSWINMEIMVQPAHGTNTNLSYFKVTCPPNKCYDGSNSANIEKGNRFYFYNITTEIIPIQENNEWYYNRSTNMLYIGSTQSNIDNIKVVIPNTDYAVRFLGDVDMINNKVISWVEYIVWSGITFMDSDYTAYGFQEGFNMEPYQGIPSDGIMRISGGNNINITNCKFLQLGGGGIVISNKTRNVLISNNIFTHIGQSGIALVGNSTSQSTFITIENNTISYIGDILASASGIYASTVSDTIIRYNNISYGSRWGIAIRSNGPNGMSYRNYLSYNRINMVGLKTRDFGGISLIGDGYTGSTLLYNCIKNVIGTDTNDMGDWLRPFFSFGVYLDNWSSGFYVFGNIAHSNILSGCFFHGGQSNYVTNNIFYNTSENMPPPGSYGHAKMGQLEISAMNGGTRPYNNSVVKNVYFYYNKTSLLVHDNGKYNISYFNEIDYNLYYNPNIKIGDVNISDFTPAGNTWNQWINAYNKKYDQNSIIDTNPMFVNEQNGNFVIDSSSPLITKLNFKPIPKYIAQC